MIKKTITGNRIFVLDTSVLLHDPNCLMNFQEHDIFIPMVVLEELDLVKKGLSEVARNARATNRFIDSITAEAESSTLENGLPLPAPHAGRLFFEIHEPENCLPTTLPGSKADNTILASALNLQNQRQDLFITLVSKDVNLRVKAHILGIHAEDYYNDHVVDDVRFLHKGAQALSANFWDAHSKDMDSWQDSGKAFYRVSGPDIANWNPNDCVFIPEEGEDNENSVFEAAVRKNDEEGAIIEQLVDHRSSKNAVWDITARNREQNFALNILMDPNIDFVSLQGSAGTGKTLLALAAGLTQIFDEKRYNEIIVTRVTVPLAEDIGFLPGTEEEKMTPWMGALMDNLEVLQQTQEGDDSWGREATEDLLKNRIKIRSLNFMRGRTFLKKFIIIDEAQNLTAKQMKALITRAGPGTKLVCLGDIAQIDTPYLTETSSGLTYIIDRMKSWEYSAHITLTKGERSRLAVHAAMVL